MPEHITPAMMVAFERELEKTAFWGTLGRGLLSFLGKRAVTGAGTEVAELAARKATEEAARLAAQKAGAEIVEQTGQQAVKGLAEQSGQAVGQAIKPSWFGQSALGQHLKQNIGGIGAGTGLGAGAGGVGGAVSGGVQGYNEAQDSGGSGAVGALSGALSGGYKGALGGAATGALIGAKGGGWSKSMADMAGGKGIGSSFARFGQRQTHALTGLAPNAAPRLTATGQLNPEYIKGLQTMRIATGSGEAQKAYEAAQAFAAANPGSEAAQKGVMRATQALQTAAKAEAIGLTHLPGQLRHLGQPGGAGDLWRLAIKPQATQQGWMGKSMVGLPVAFAGYEAATPSQEGGPGKGERVGSSLGSGLGYALTPFMPFIGGEMTGRAIGKATGGVGKMFDEMFANNHDPYPYVLGANPGAPQVEEGSRSHAVERHTTNRAQGLPPEDAMSV